MEGQEHPPAGGTEAAVERRSHSRYELHDAQQGTTSEDIEYSRDEEDESEVALRKELQAEQHRRARDYARQDRKLRREKNTRRALAKKLEKFRLGAVDCTVR